MTVVTTRWVLWIGLLLLLPIPIYGQNWAVLPVINLLKTLFNNSLAGEAINLLLWLQGLAAAGYCWLLAFAYSHWSAHWPTKIRGSIMGAFLLTALIIFSSVPIYYSLPPLSERLNFLQL